MKDRREDLARQPRGGKDYPPGSQLPPWLRCADKDKRGLMRIAVYYNPEVRKYVAQFEDMPLLSACHDSVPTMFQSLAMSVQCFVERELPKYDGLDDVSKRLHWRVGEFKEFCEMKEVDDAAS